MTKHVTLIVIFTTLVYCVLATSDRRPHRRVLGQADGKRRRIDPRCRGRYGLLPLPEDETCSTFLVCRRGKATVGKCPDGLRFDSVKFCTHGEADCGRNTATRLARGVESSANFVDHPENSIQYIVQEDSPSPSFQSDEEPILLSEEDPSSACSRDGLYPDPTDCGRYVHCSAGRGRSRPCPRGLHFSPQTGRCESPCVAQCDPTVSCNWKSSISDAPDRTLVLCAREDLVGVFLNPDNCSTYVECSWDEDITDLRIVSPKVRSCPEGLHFSAHNKTCLPPCEARCDLSLAGECGWEDVTTAPETDVDVCAQPPYRPNELPTPDCTGVYVRRFTYHPVGESCRFVLYGGCPSSANLFKTLKECAHRCLNITGEVHPRGVETLLVCANVDRHEKFMNPDACTHYVECSPDDYTMVNACPEGQHFSAATKTCLPPCEARCDMSLAQQCGWQDVTTSTPETDIDVCSQPPYQYEGVAPPNCRGFYVTRFSYQADTGTCYATLYGGCTSSRNLFKTLKQCEDRCTNVTQTSDSIQRSELDFQCVRDGLFRNPDNCATYIQCSKGMSYVMPCPQGLHFSEEASKCQAACDAHCDLSMSDECGWEEENPNQVEKSPKYPTFAAPREYSCVRDGLYPNPNSCDIFVRCHEGYALVIHCPENQHFSQETRRCEPVCDAHCDPTLAEKCGWERREYAVPKQDIICTKNGLHSNPHNCSTYVQCTSGQSYVMPCPGGLHFSLGTQRCERPCEAHCDPELAEQCGWEEGEYIKKLPQYDDLCKKGGVFPELCTRYIQCSGGRAYGIPCPKGLHFSLLTLKCEMPCDAYCDPDLAERCGWEEKTYSLKQPIFDFRCLHNGLFENHADCGTFVQCTGGVAYLISCPVGLHFNPSTLKCEEPCEARCAPDIEEKCSQEKSHSLGQIIEGGRCFHEGLYRNPKDCNSFIECKGQITYFVPCPVGLHFNSGTNRCDPPCVALCDPRVARRCRKDRGSRRPRVHTLKYELYHDLDCEEDGLYQDVYDCTQYIQCSAGHSYVMHCPAGLHFGRKASRCVPPCDAHCNGTLAERCGWELKDYVERRPEYDIFCVKDGAHQSPEGCTGYIQCFKGEAYFVDCPDGLHYGPEAGRCQPPCEARCDLFDEEWAEICGWKIGLPDSTTPVDVGGDSLPTDDYDPSLIPDVECPEDKIWGTTGDCTTYLECWDTKAHVRTCPPGKHFSKETLGCVSPCEARCDRTLACECGWKECTKKVTEIDCEAEFDAGPCEGSFPRYYYDYDSGRCRSFTYGGCGGNGNNFETEAECETQCRQTLLGGFRCPDKNGKFGHYPDCTRYYECKRGVPTLKRCPRGTAFDHLKSKCVTEHKATCMYQCREPDAVYPYEQDCHKYIDCVNGISKLEKCPPGTAFDYRERDCVEAEKVSCS